MPLAAFWEEFQEAAEDDKAASERGKQQKPKGIKYR